MDSPSLPSRVLIAYDATKDLGNDEIQVTIKEVRMRGDILRRGDTLVVFGVLHKIQHPMGYHTLALAPVSSNRAMVEEVSKKVHMYVNKLLPSAQECEDEGVDIEVKVTAGTPIKQVILQEIVAYKTTWVIFDRHLRRDLRNYINQIPSKVALIQDNLSVKVLRSQTTSGTEVIENKLFYSLSKLVEQSNISSSSFPTPANSSESSNVVKSNLMSSFIYRSQEHNSSFYDDFGSSSKQEKSVYVDDIVITGSDQNGIQKLKQHLFTHFQTKDLGKLKYFLGIEIAQSSSGVVLSQRKYALDILEEIGMLDCKPVDTPMDPNVKLIPGQGEPLRDPGRYRRLVGKLNYLTITRPNISFSVSVVSQFLQSPCDSHWDAVICIFRYIKSTLGQGVLYENKGHTQVVGYTDADWAGSPIDRRFTSGYCVFIGGICTVGEKQYSADSEVIQKQFKSIFRKRSSEAPVLCAACGMKTILYIKESMKFSFSELQLATDDFSKENLLGEGGYGHVYKGELKDGQIIAAKVRKEASMQGFAEFHSEVFVLSFARHKNIVMLLGYCCKENFNILVYEYICNKSLEWHLFDKTATVLEWHQRRAIAIGTAKGLRFLHKECRGGPIIHRDMRPSNILLTHDFVPMLGDFGLAKWRTNDDPVHTRVLGTFGYLAPEYAENGMVSVRTDVYAFGMVLLQLISGRKVIDPTREGHQQSLRQWAEPLIVRLALHELIDPRIEDSYDTYELYLMARAAYLCVQSSPEMRPSMGEVTRLLEGENEHLHHLGEQFIPHYTKL
uniref:Protein kinase domain-containing protein n=1 Tax=Vitis vinifera TaxID=29760 RepID=F6GZU0_VITVI